MRTRWWHSQRFRIALVIFLLEAIVLGIVLWQTLGHSHQKANELINEQDRIALDLLTEDSSKALLTLEYGRLSEIFERAADNPHILQINLIDSRGLVVASDRPALLGKARPAPRVAPDSYMRSIPLESLASEIGFLEVHFSNAELKNVYAQTITLGIGLALGGMLLIALAGISLGHLLTRRLQQLTRHAQAVAAGHRSQRIYLRGKDEVSQLGEAINTMIGTLANSFDQMKQMAFRDELTGLANRLQFHQRVERAIASARKHHHSHVLLYLDLDQFKIVNDTCGHDAGDRLLVELAGMLSGTLRGRDTVARLGGDEFGILLEGLDKEEAETVAEKIRLSVQEFRFSVGDKAFQVGASIGAVVLDEHVHDMKQALSLADMACYTAKDSGRNNVVFASDADGDTADRSAEMQWVPEIQTALQERRFHLLRQRIDMIDNDQPPVGWEFLVRLRGRDGEDSAPQRFIAAAERYDLMPRLDRHIVRLVCKAISEGALEDEQALAFVNLSAQTLLDREFPTFLAEQTHAAGIDPARLCFEITETAAINNYNAAQSFMQALRRIGCRFSLDDFGSGMCSFNYLKRLAVDFVKIDGSFTSNMLDNSLDDHIIQAISDIAHTAGFKTIAEFVEQPEQLERLREIGIDHVQGYLIHRPQSVGTGTSNHSYS